MATSSTRSRRRRDAKGNAHAGAVKRLWKLKEQSIPPAALAIAGGDRMPSAEMMGEALKMGNGLAHEAQQVNTIRQRLVDLPASWQPCRALLL